MILSLFQAFFSVIDMIVGLYIGVILIEAIISWMIAYEVLSSKDSKIAQIMELLNRLTSPALDKIRKHVSPIAGFDLSPVVAILILVFIQKFLRASGLSV